MKLEESKNYASYFVCDDATIDKITIDKESDKAYFELSCEDDDGLHKIEFSIYMPDSGLVAEGIGNSFIHSALTLPIKKLEIK